MYTYIHSKSNFVYVYMCCIFTISISLYPLIYFHHYKAHISLITYYDVEIGGMCRELFTSIYLKCQEDDELKKYLILFNSENFRFFITSRLKRKEETRILHRLKNCDIKLREIIGDKP